MCTWMPVHTFNPRSSKETYSKMTWMRETSLKVSYESVHILSQWSDLHGCLWWEGTPERGVTDHRDTMPWRGPSVQNTTIHQHSQHSYPVCLPLSWLHEKSPLLLCRKTNGSETHIYSHIQTLVQTCINTNTYEHNICTEKGSHIGQSLWGYIGWSG